MKIQHEEKANTSMSKVSPFKSTFGSKEVNTGSVIDYSNPFALPNVLECLDDGKYGSVTKEFEALRAQRIQVINFLSGLQQSCGNSSHNGLNGSKLANIIDLDDDHDANSGPKLHENLSDSRDGPKDFCVKRTEENDIESPIIIDSDEEDGSRQEGSKNPVHPENRTLDFRSWLERSIYERVKQVKMMGQAANDYKFDQTNLNLVGQTASEASCEPSIQYQMVVLQKMPENDRLQDVASETHMEKSEKQVGEALNYEKNEPRSSDANSNDISLPGMEEHSPTTNGSQVDENEALESDGLEDLWKDMSVAMECSKIAASDEPCFVEQQEECNHSYVLEDDLGLVCRICGVIEKSIETIFDYQWTKGTRAARAYMTAPRLSNDADNDVEYNELKPSDDNMILEDIALHPRHLKQIKPHQLEGFNFLVKNLLADKPGGCILAHAPGSGKTFMLISFIQSFLAKYPFARPLIILPKGILPTWKKEFRRWQVEDIPLYDFYSANANNRSEQLEVLNHWQESKSILLLGYKQFTNIICGGANSKVAAACKERLLNVPGLLILDEGHTPRNEDTHVLDSLAKIQTRRKVVLSGTLFQNHVKEVFNILNLVRPKFLKMEFSRSIMKRVLSRVSISGNRRVNKGTVDGMFYDLVEETLQNDDGFKRKATVIQDLRELTKNVLHYYKGDFLDELPGLVDFTVLLNLSPAQKEIVRKLPKYEKFKRNAVGTALYIHPRLSDISVVAAGERACTFNDAKIDSLIDSMNLRDGVKTNFFLNILSLSASAGEKLLAFSQYILPLKFLERVVVKTKGWLVGREIFMISGDSSSESRERSMDQFNNSPDAKVLFGSIKACGEGISLVGASRVLILDVHLNPSVTRQAIGRAFRPGQGKKVYVYRLVAADSPEENDHKTSFRKELIAKMWFEWSEYCSNQEFELGEVDISSCQDMFLESSVLGQDVKALYRR
uniref:Protein CHROMATIN REMODELING 35-like n=1 Tax=Ananas comosus var. bracteatus TaxID=296719 RepID=A0A6V7PB59_ANACO|nr:unnamed protein product [Ananas comosus var. bracteatus]